MVFEKFSEILTTHGCARRALFYGARGRTENFRRQLCVSEMLEKLKNSILKNSIILKTNNLILKFIYTIFYLVRKLKKLRN